MATHMEGQVCPRRQCGEDVSTAELLSGSTIASRADTLTSGASPSSPRAQILVLASGSMKLRGEKENNKTLTFNF